MFEHLYGFAMPGAHTALGDVTGLERVLSAPGIRERWVNGSAGRENTPPKKIHEATRRSFIQGKVGGR